MKFKNLFSIFLFVVLKARESKYIFIAVLPQLLQITPLFCNFDLHIIGLKNDYLKNSEVDGFKVEAIV
jgi:hypothetical protein